MNEELIEHWMILASAVFRAEDKLRPQWVPKLLAAADGGPELKEKTTQAYLRAIAEEIISIGGQGDDEEQ